MDFDESAADSLIAACDEAAAVLSGQRGPRASVTGEGLEGFRGSFADLFRQNAGAQLAARNKLVDALEDLTRQTRFAKSQAEQARQDLKNEQAKALREYLDEGFVAASAEYLRSQFLGIPTPTKLSESGVRRPEVVLSSLVFEPHHWGSNGGSGTSSAVPDALEKAAALVFDQQESAELVCQDVVRALDQFQDSCTWVLCDVGTFAPAVSRFATDDRDDADKLRRIGEAFSTAGKGAELGTLVEISATSLALAISPKEVDGEALLKFFAAASTLDLEIASENPEWLTHLASVPPERIAAWWAELRNAGSNATSAYSAQQLVLLESAPKVFGSLDGIPALSRVYANKLGAVRDLEDAESLLASLMVTVKGNSMAFQSEERREFLAKEIDYLKMVVAGEVQLYLYDREKSRIIEMLGTPGLDTQRTITYVPGLFTSMKSFYNGEVQQVSGYISGLDPNTVAFIYKDGLFPGEDPREGGQDMKRVPEANDPQRGLDAGKQLAGFQQGMRLDPLLQGTEQVGFGHSWGYQNLTSSEIYGSHYDKSISLSGAGMNEDWAPNADTQYSNFVYGGDGLRGAQRTGWVWDGHVPGTHGSFTQHKYDRPNRESWLPDLSPIEDHNLIASDSTDNSRALEDILREVRE